LSAEADPNPARKTRERVLTNILKERTFVLSTKVRFFGRS
jgi:hypothetical protein